MVTLLQRRWKVIFLVGILFSIAALIITFLFPLDYRADAQVLITPKTRFGVDPYTVVKSAERVGENVAQVMKTDDFLAKVRAQEGHAIDWREFDQLNDRQKRKAWPKMVEGAVVYGTGVLNVSGYSPVPAQARELAAAAVEAIAAKGWEYTGGDMVMKVVNNPVVTAWPVRPNVAVNMIAAFVVGILLTSVIVVRNR